MMRQVNFTQPAEYNIFTCQESSSLMAFFAEVLIRGRTKNEAPICCLGQGWNALSAIDEAAYQAITLLRHQLPEMAIHFCYFPARLPHATHRNYPGFPNHVHREPNIPLIHLTELVMSLDKHLALLHE